MLENTLTILPSDRYALLVKKYNDLRPKEISCVITPIDMTHVYNWYVDNIEKYFNRLALQGIATLFKFLVEQYIVQCSDNVFFIHAEGMVIKDEYNLNNPDMLLSIIPPFIKNNGIPYEIDPETFLLKLLDNGMLEMLKNRVIGLLTSHSLKIAYPMVKMDLEIDWDTEPIIHIPIRWEDVTLDSALHAKGDMSQYLLSHPFDKKLIMYIASLPMVAVSYMEIRNLLEVIENCIRPIQVDMEKDIYV